MTDLSVPGADGSHPARPTLARAVFPPDASARDAPAWSVVGILLLGLAWVLRIPAPATLDRVWAEDGDVFLAGADRHGLGVFFSPYNGYMHAGPRVVAAVAAVVSPRNQGPALLILTGLVMGALAVISYHAVKGLTGLRLAGAVLAVYTVGCPTGLETLGSLANLQWRLLSTAVIAVLWTPRRVVGAVTVGLLVVVTCLSTPFGFGVAGLVLLRLALRTTRRDVATAAAAVVASVVQAVVIIGAPARAQLPAPDAAGMAYRYMLRVVSGATVGENYTREMSFPTTVELSAVISVVLGVVLLFACLAGGAAVTARVGLLLVASVGLFVLPMLVNAPPLRVYGSQRYYVAPAILLIAAVAVAGAGAWRRHLSPAPDVAVADSFAAGRAGVRARMGVAAGGVALTAAAAVVVVTVASWSLEPETFGPVRSWQTGVVAAATQCQTHPGAATWPVAINPDGWFFPLDCRAVR